MFPPPHPKSSVLQHKGMKSDRKALSESDFRNRLTNLHLLLKNYLPPFPTTFLFKGTKAISSMYVDKKHETCPIFVAQASRAPWHRGRLRNRRGAARVPRALGRWRGSPSFEPR